MKINYKKHIQKLLKKVKSVSDQKKIFNKLVDTFCDVDTSYKTPRTKHLYVGVEIECFGNEEEGSISAVLFAEGLDKYVQIGNDSSISSYEDFSYEFRVLAKENEIAKVLTRLGKVFEHFNLEVNNSCGLHVHLDMRHRDFKACVKKLYKLQDVLFCLVDKDRWDNEYCSYSEESSSTDKYSSINTSSYWERKTIEVRLHEGTTDFKKIIKWVQLLVNIVSAKSSPKEATKADVLKWSGLNKNLKSYINRNWDQSFFKYKKEMSRGYEEAEDEVY